MIVPVPALRQLITVKAALTRHYGPDDPRTRAAAAELRLARLRHAIQAAELTEDDRHELARLLLGA